MASQDIEPQLGAESFSCPHCDATVAHHDWFSLFVGGGGGGLPSGITFGGVPRYP
jgi:hypothetical protein